MLLDCGAGNARSLVGLVEDQVKEMLQYDADFFEIKECLP
jgi:hypothetical protein